MGPGNREKGIHMIYRQLAGTDYRVSALALGSALFGATYSEAFSFGQLDIFAQAGGNLVDTAHVYNDWIPGEKSRSEKVIGRWMAKNGMRSQMVVLTKGAHPPMDDMGHSRVRYEEIQKDIEESLDNLQTGYVDLYLLHRDDVDVPVGEIVGWMNGFIEDGYIRHWGCSNWTTERIIQANAYAGAHGLQGMRVNQTMWSFASIQKDKLSDQTLVPLDEEAYRYHQASGLNLMAFTSQAKGYFPRLHEGEKLPPDLTLVYGSSRNEEKLAFLRRASERTGLSIAELTLLFFLKHPFIAIPVVSYDTDELLRAGLQPYREGVESLLQGISFPLSF